MYCILCGNKIYMTTSAKLSVNSSAGASSTASCTCLDKSAVGVEILLALEDFVIDM